MVYSDLLLVYGRIPREELLRPRYDSEGTTVFSLLDGDAKVQVVQLANYGNCARRLSIFWSTVWDWIWL